MLVTAASLDFVILAKWVFGFTPDNLWSPMCLPSELLDSIVDEFLDKNKKRLSNQTYFYAALKDLKEKQTYAEMFPDTYKQGLVNGKASVQQLDRRRNTDIEKILAKDKRVLDWWKSI